MKTTKKYTQKENLIEEINKILFELSQTNKILFSDDFSSFIVELPIPNNKYNYIRFYKYKIELNTIITHKFLGNEILSNKILQSLPLLTLFFIKIQIKNTLLEHYEYFK
jgi:hypothetical protein